MGKGFRGYWMHETRGGASTGRILDPAEKAREAAKLGLSIASDAPRPPKFKRAKGPPAWLKRQLERDP